LWVERSHCSIARKIAATKAEHVTSHSNDGFSSKVCCLSATVLNDLLSLNSLLLEQFLLLQTLEASLL
jgi:hypothetical protein